MFSLMRYKSALFGVGCALLGCAGVHAQTTLSGDHVITGNLDVGTSSDRGNLTVTGQAGNAAAPGIKVTGDGGVVFEGNVGTGQIPATGTGARFMWYPKKAATRVGVAPTDGWNDSNTGIGSFATSKSFAGGTDSFASTGGVAVGENSFASARGIAGKVDSVGLGVLGIGGGPRSIALNGSTYGDLSVGILGMTYGDLSVAIGSNGDNPAYSGAMCAIAIGAGAIANSYGSVVIGAGTALGNENEWVDTDPMFVVGCGTGLYMGEPESQNRNAFVIYKNGNINMPKRQGDILMGEFGIPE